MRLRITFCLLSLLLLATACNDLTAPQKGVKRYVGYGPGRKNAALGYSYTCATYDMGQSWSCEIEWLSDPNSGGGMDFWDYQNNFHTSTDCSLGTGARYCDNNFQGGGGLSPYSDPRVLDVSNSADYNVDAIPTCPASSSAPESRRAYCAGHIATTTELQVIQAALTRMHQIGGICDALATIGDSVVAGHRERIYPQSTYTHGGWAPIGGGASGPNSWFALSEDVLKYSAAHPGLTQDPTSGLWYHDSFQAKLAHELDHLYGNPHMMINGVENAVLTPNTRVCADLDMGTGSPTPY